MQTSLLSGYWWVLNIYRQNDNYKLWISLVGMLIRGVRFVNKGIEIINVNKVLKLWISFLVTTEKNDDFCTLKFGEIK